MLKGLAIGTVLLAFSMLLIFPMSSVHAQLGEVAGTPIILVNISGTATHNYTFLNTGDQPIPFEVILPTLNVIKNVTSPVVTAYPMNGTIVPHGIKQVKVTIFLPQSSKIKVGDQWSGLMQVVAIAGNTSLVGGASISEGVAKNVIIQAAPAVFNDSILLIIGVIVVAIVVVAAVYMLVIRPGRVPKKAVAPASAAKSTSAARKASTRRRTSPKGGKKATSKRKTSRKSSGRRTTARSRRR